MIGAGALGKRRFRGSAGRCDYDRAAAFRQLNENAPDAAGGRVDEHAFAGTDLVRVAHQILRGQGLQHRGARDVVGDAGRYLETQALGHGDELRVAARLGESG